MECVSPAVDKDCTVQASIDQDFTGGLFHYYTQTFVDAVRPSKGPVLGGTDVEVVGRHFHSRWARNMSQWCSTATWYAY